MVLGTQCIVRPGIVEALGSSRSMYTQNTEFFEVRILSSSISRDDLTDARILEEKRR